MGLRTSYAVVKTAVQQWFADGASSMGAALAYYALFSIAPLLILATAIAGYFYGEEAASGAVRAHLVDTVGSDAAGTIQDLIKSASAPAVGGWASVLGVAMLLLGALGAFLQLRSDLTTIWKLAPVGGGFLSTIINYAVSLVMIVVCGAFLLLSLVASTALTAVRHSVDDWLPGHDLVWRFGEPALSFLLFTLLLAALFRVLSAWQLSWGSVAYGAMVTALLFTAGKIVIGYYLATSGVASVYGAAGSLVAFLVWVYYSSQILFFGAELIQARRTLTSS